MRNSVKSALIGVVAVALLTAASLTLSARAADSSDANAGPDTPFTGMMWGGYGPGMMRGYGPGMMRGYGPGATGGYGPGMMWGGYGRGMMGAYGPGMMWGGFGPGMMMGDMALYTLDLSSEQRTKINKILDAERRQHWAVMGKMLDEQAKLRDLYAAEEPDPRKVGAVYSDTAKLRQQMIETHVQASNEVTALLTPEQRKQLETWRREGWGAGFGRP